jgi:hypothetical protein
MEIDMTIRQVQTKKAGIQSIMRSAAFVVGFNEARKGRPLDYEAFVNPNSQWNYERGRQFGLIFDGPLKKGRVLNIGAVLYFGQAISMKEIF